MSMKKWRKLASEKAEVEQQNASILAAIKNNKIEKGFSQLSGEELFKPITSRLEKLQVETATKEEEETPDYGMEDFDLNNPFDGDFNPDAETPTPTPTPSPTPSPSPSPISTPPPSPTSTPLPPLAEEEELEESGGKPEEKPSKWGPPQELVIKGSESVDLQTLNSMLTKNRDNPGYVVKSPKSKFYGYTMADIKKARDEILARRKGIKQLPRKDLAEWLNPPPLDDETEREMEGSGSIDLNALVERLHLSLASIQAGNTSLKLKKKVQQMLGLLVSQNEITEKEAHKILEAII